MSWPRPIRSLPFGLSLACMLLGGATAATQTPAEQVAAAAVAWVTSDQVAERELQTAVKVLVQHHTAAIDWLAAELPAALAKPTEPRGRGVTSLATHFVLGFLEQQRKTEMVFVGQYDALARLQPFVGELLFQLLLETPDWYPLTFREHLIAPLRDLQPKPPQPDRLAATRKLCAAVEVEPEALRRLVAAMLWQWGEPAAGKAVVARLQQATTEGEAEDRLLATLALADYQVLLRDYKAAASTHRAAQALARSCDVPLRPAALYAAACVHALLGEVDRGIDALDRCATLLASPHLDTSLRIKRTLFDNDPELALLRQDPRFAAIVEKAFGAAVDPPGGR